VVSQSDGNGWGFMKAGRVLAYEACMPVVACAPAV
jgi:hypothetical protein